MEPYSKYLLADKTLVENSLVENNADTVQHNAELEGWEGVPRSYKEFEKPKPNEFYPIHGKFGVILKEKTQK